MNFLKLILIDAIFDALYFPFWWYSRGLVLAFKWTFGEIRGVMDFLGVHIWIANLFKPMFGQTDWQGKIISFLMRVFQIVFRSLALFGFSAFYLILFVVYLILPIVIVYFIILHLG
ncbi:hypothetical protein KJ885_04520, partial [Patescibacteria group bacterium]|nr:hypothetical protein [Patescibacteria group bacterium]